MAYETILIPLDGSERWQIAVDAALPLAKAFHSKVILCSVFDWAPERFGIYQEFPSHAEFAKAVRSHHEAVLNRAHQRLLSEGVEATTVLKEGQAAESIVERASQVSADLIVMASHARKGVPRFFLGSVTDGVLRQSPCPVLVVRPAEGG